MERYKSQNKIWPIGIILMLCIAFSCRVFLKFDLVVTWSITIVMALTFISLGETIISYHQGKSLADIHILWGLSTIIVFVVGFYFMEQGSYRVDENYSEWLMGLTEIKSMYIEFEVVTLIWTYYALFMFLYGKTIWQIAKKHIEDWVPHLSYLILGVGVALYTKETFDHVAKLATILIVGGVLIVYLIFKAVAGREQKIIYNLSPKRYLSMMLVCFLTIVGMGVALPECRELPAARWIRKVASVWNSHATLQNKIPLETHLSDEFPLSDAILFEVNATEPLYLRNIAYTNYENGVWSIASQGEEMDGYIPFKPQYLKAEYLQIKSLLDEISYQNAQNNKILSNYAEIASHEASVSYKKQYTVIQNPINKINYFTVNGVTDIKDDSSEGIYYYQNINNCYFYGEELIEPSHYTVEYYDHTPKFGSREYLFLRKMNVVSWESIYRQVVRNRSIYEYEYEELPKLLLTYTPIVQYKNAKKDFLQIPKDLVEPLRELAKKITFSQYSDWANAEAICNYLKTKYRYSLHSKKTGENDLVYEFLFKTQEGICQDFATSMVLMCRSIGIPAKYVTGYLVSEKNNETGRYIVREKDAHAFVEAYISGYGWMTFDPTPSRQADEIEGKGNVGGSNKAFIEIISVLVITVGVILLSKGGSIYIKEMIWMAMLRFKKPARQIEILMLRTSMWLERFGYRRESYETLSQYAKRLMEKEIDIISLTQYYEAYKYGNLPLDKVQIMDAYAYYKALKKKLKNK